MSTRVVLLGPDPSNGSYSTFNYFRSCAAELGHFARALRIDAECPADSTTKQLPKAGRGRVWARNYIEWPMRLRRLEADAFHVVDQGLAWYGKFLSKGARFVTVHDLINYLTLQGELPFTPLSHRRGWLLRRCVSEIQRADHVFAISEFTASSLMKYLALPAQKVTVTPNYAESSFKPVPDTEKRSVRTRLFGLAEYAIVCVGSSAEYKNRIGALRVFNSLSKKLGGAHLHIAGGKASPQEVGFIREVSLQHCVHYWGQLSVETMAAFYNAADALIFSSIYEGFGLPPLEAMQCGCPVVTTTCGSLREVVGEAALTVDDPSAVEVMAQHLQAILKDDALRTQLRYLGLRQAARFTLERSMRGIAEVYERFLA